MSETSESKAEASAEKAYAVAAEAVPVTKKEAAGPAETAPEPAEPEEVLTVPAIADKPKAKAAKGAAPAKRAPAKKVRKTEAKTKPVRKAAGTASKAPKKSAAKVSRATTKPAAKGAAAKKSASNAPTNLKDKTMTKTAKTKTAKTKADIEKIVAEAQAKAKIAAAKGGEIFGEARDFSKGNVDAVVESGKILANGIQAMAKEAVADTKSTYELVTGEVKDLAAVKSPSEFFKLQGDIARKNLDTALSLTEKNANSLAKLASASFAPISGRFSLAVEKVRKVAA